MESIQILMSTYNGEKYIAKQIESILNQSEVMTFLLIRDDGSTDGTVEIIEKYMKKYPNRISLIKGNNIGYRKSFLLLLSKTSQYRYYGFSDQDDIWMPNKCREAIKKLKSIESDIALYASGVKLVDDKGNLIKEINYDGYEFTIEKYFNRARLAGCTFVFTEKLREIAEKFSNLDLKDNMPDHDFVVGSCAFACGKVIIDTNSYIYHVRHKKAETSGGNGIIKRVKVEWKNIFTRKYVKSTMARLLIENKDITLNKESRSFLTDIANYQESIVNQLNLISNKKMKTGIRSCDFETKLKIFLKNY